MNNIQEFLNLNPYELKKRDKNKLFFKFQKNLSRFHKKNCSEYNKISSIFFEKLNKINCLSDLPYIHSNIFKNFNLKSTNNNSFTMNSSGTSGQVRSKINIDFQTSIIQAEVLKKIIFDFIPKTIDTIVIVGNEKNIKKQKYFDAKSVAIKGISRNFKKKIFLLKENNSMDKKKIIKIIKNYKQNKILFFGMTDNIWDNLLEGLKRNKIKFPKNNWYLIHGGGWKKLQNKSITKKKFTNELRKITNISKIYNYYGMIEQAGSIYMECEEGYFHSSIFSDILIRDKNLGVEKNKRFGLIQTMSILPISYPGHNILTEDIGAIIGEDNCKCGRKGKYFSYLKRVKNAEARGCSNV